MLQSLEAYNISSNLAYDAELQLLHADILLSQGDKDLGLIELEAAQSRFESNSNIKGQAMSHFVLTMYYKGQADYVNAISSAYEAVKYYELIDDNYNLAKIFNQICDIFWYQRKWIEGLDYGLKAVELLQDQGPSSELAYAYQLLSDTYLQTADFDIALEYSNRAITMKESMGLSPLEVTGAYNSRANVYKYLEEYDNAIADYESNLKLCDSLGYQRCIRVALANLGHIHFLKEEYDKVIPYKLRAIAIQKNTGNIQQIGENLDQLSEAYVAIGDYSSAYEARVELDSVLAIEYEQNLNEISNELHVQYQTEQNLERVSNLNQRVSLQRIALILGGAILLLSLGGIALFRSLNKKLKLKNRENEILLKEIHHRVKNNLQILSSLLSLQSNSLIDPNAIDALSESRNRVESMGLIHQRLYTNEDITSVNIKDYISELCRSLEDSFSNSERHFNINEQIEYETLDVDYAIPLGLIINELVTNSIKYAFGDQTQVELNISLSETIQGLILTVSDNGKSLKSINEIQIIESFGSQLIKTLSKKMKGSISIDTSHGYTTQIIFKRYTQQVVS